MSFYQWAQKQAGFPFDAGLGASLPSFQRPEVPAPCPASRPYSRQTPVVRARVACLMLLGAGLLACTSDDDSGTGTPADSGENPPPMAGMTTQPDEPMAGMTAQPDQPMAACTNGDVDATHTEAAVMAAEDFLAALSDTERASVAAAPGLATAALWSNIPSALVARNGIGLGELEGDALAATMSLLEVVAGSDAYNLMTEIRAADDWLVSDGGGDPATFGSGFYFISIHGTPSTDAAWMVQLSGHHLSYNFTYGAACTSASPLFDAVEPTSWTDLDGVVHAPLGAQEDAVIALLEAASQYDEALIPGTFSDLVNGPVFMGPGNPNVGDIKYPDDLYYPEDPTERGVSVATFTPEEKQLVKNAIEAWVDNAAEPVSQALLAIYESEEALNQTYVAYAGAADLSVISTYVRIDGPRVWIEVSVQPGIVYSDQPHIHTIFRDKLADYGAQYAGE